MLNHVRLMRNFEISPIALVTFKILLKYCIKYMEGRRFMCVYVQRCNITLRVDFSRISEPFPGTFSRAFYPAIGLFIRLSDRTAIGATGYYSPYSTKLGSFSSGISAFRANMCAPLSIALPRNRSVKGQKARRGVRL